MRARVIVTMKEKSEDHAGVAVCDGLKAIGHRGVSAVSVGRVFFLEMEKDENAQSALVEMCETLLVDTTREAYTIEFVED